MLEKAISLSYDYVRVNYIVNRIHAKLNNPPSSIFTYVKDCNYALFAIPEECIAIMEGDDKEQLASLYTSYVLRLESINVALFHLIANADMEQKMQLHTMLQERMQMCISKADEQFINYWKLVSQIQEKLAAKKKEDLFSLSRISKQFYSSCYEFQALSHYYSHLVHYLSGMIQCISLK